MPAAANQPFGRLADGREVTRHLLVSPGGTTLAVLDLGATLQSLRHRGDDARTEVVAGFETLEDYQAAKAIYAGAIVGRYANRIARSSVTIDGRDHELSANEGSTCLHGGRDGFDQRIWSLLERSDDAVTFGLVSPDGDQGFPGELTARATYRVVDGAAILDLSATTTAPTVCLLTTHAYLNVGRAGSTDDQLLTVDADGYVPIDATLIPLGEIEPVAGTPFDLSASALVRERIASDHPQIALVGGIDHSFDVTGTGLRRHARLESPQTGAAVEVHSDQAGIQVFTSNFGDGGPLTSAGRVPRGFGVALEPQQHPDAPHQPWNTVILRPGEQWSSRVEWRLSGF